VQDVFEFRNRLVDEYSAFSRSFSRISAADLAQRGEEEYARGRYWPVLPPVKIRRHSLARWRF
jgi:hypothetical protein